MEVTDIVDEQDRVIGQMTVEERRKTNELHRGVYVIVERSDGKIVLQKRSMQKNHDPGTWDFVSGGVQAGESYEEAALREMKEEMFVDLELPAFALEELFKFRFKSETGNAFLMVFKTKYDGAFSIDPVEVDELKWVEWSKMVADIFKNPDSYPDVLKVCLQEYRKKF